MTGTVAAIIIRNGDERRYHGNPECNRIRRRKGELIVVTIVDARARGFLPCHSFTRERSTISPCWTPHGYVVPDEMAAYHTKETR